MLLFYLKEVPASLLKDLQAVKYEHAVMIACKFAVPAEKSEVYLCFYNAETFQLVSLPFPTGGQLVVTGRQPVLILTSFYEKNFL